MRLAAANQPSPNRAGGSLMRMKHTAREPARVAPASTGGAIEPQRRWKKARKISEMFRGATAGETKS